MKSQIKNLMDCWDKIKNKQEVKIKDVDELEGLFGSAMQKMDELQKRGDHFKELYQGLKNKEKRK
jgi:hypothetical protein